MALTITQDKAKYDAGTNDPQVILIHQTYGHYAGDMSVFTGESGTKVSIHFYIPRDGRCIQFLPLNRGANHAGIGSSWANIGMADYGRVNTHSIGIELEGIDEDTIFTKEQLNTLDALIVYIDGQVKSLWGRGPIPIHYHDEIAPTHRTNDPNQHFPRAEYKLYRQQSKPSYLPRWYWIWITTQNKGQADALTDQGLSRGLKVARRTWTDAKNVVHYKVLVHAEWRKTKAIMEFMAKLKTVVNTMRTTQASYKEAEQVIDKL